MAIPETPITRQEMYLDAIARNAGGGGGGAADNRFVVTCTPTAADYSGTMDATGLHEAYKAGKNILFAIGHESVPIAAVSKPDENHVAFTFYLFSISLNLLVVGHTGTITSDTSTTAYSTNIYQLTPLTT